MRSASNRLTILALLLISVCSVLCSVTELSDRKLARRGSSSSSSSGSRGNAPHGHGTGLNLGLSLKPPGSSSGHPSQSSRLHPSHLDLSLKPPGTPSTYSSHSAQPRPLDLKLSLKPARPGQSTQMHSAHPIGGLPEQSKAKRPLAAIGGSFDPSSRPSKPKKLDASSQKGKQWWKKVGGMPNRQKGTAPNYEQQKHYRQNAKIRKALKNLPRPDEHPSPHGHPKGGPPSPDAGSHAVSKRAFHRAE